MVDTFVHSFFPLPPSEKNHILDAQDFTDAYTRGQMAPFHARYQFLLKRMRAASSKLHLKEENISDTGLFDGILGVQNYLQACIDECESIMHTVQTDLSSVAPHDKTVRCASDLHVLLRQMQALNTPDDQMCP